MTDKVAADPALAIAAPLVAGFEAFRSAPYLDPNIWTYGFGFTYTPDMKKVTADTPPISHEDAMAFMGNILTKTLAAVRAMVHVPVTDNQAAALTSFAYNEGTERLRTSRLMLAFNQGKIEEAAADFMSFVYIKQQYSRGLANRRLKEKALFLAGVEMQAAPAPAPALVSAASDLTADQLDDLYNGAPA
jgi:lysozyme